ncbi:MAG: TRAP transporter TatT component family protein [Calditrichia bacterium]
MTRNLFLSIIFLLLSSCGATQKIALNVTTGLFAYGIDALYAEPDLEVAKIATAANLKLIEGFHLADPGKTELLEILAQGFSSYSLGFLEDEHPERASAMYLRAKAFGEKILMKKKAFKNGIPKNDDKLKVALATLDKDDLPGLFWTSFAWAGWVNLNRDKPEAVFDLSRVKTMMNRVIELDESFFFGAAHLFWGSINGSIPRMLGGDPDKAKEHFEKVLELTDNKSLITYVYYAKYYAAPTLNEELFDELLKKVDDAPMDILPGFELLTALAKQKGAALMAQKEDIL